MKKKILSLFLLVYLILIAQNTGNILAADIIYSCLDISTLSPELMIKSEQLKGSFNYVIVERIQQLQELEFTAIVTDNQEEILDVFEQWYTAKKRKLALHPALEARIRSDKTQLYYTMANKYEGEEIAAVSLLYLMEEPELSFFFENTGLGKTGFPVWHRAITETDADYKGYGLGSYLAELTVEDLQEQNYIHGFVEYQGDHPQGQQRWEQAYRRLGFSKVEIDETGLSFFLRAPNKAEQKILSSDVCIPLDDFAKLNQQLVATQTIMSAI